MDIPVLRISHKKYTGESAIVSMRIPKELLSEIDTVADETGRTRNELLTKFIEFSLDHMEIVDQDIFADEEI